MSRLLLQIIEIVAASEESLDVNFIDRAQTRIKYAKYDSLYGPNVIENVNILSFVSLLFVTSRCYS